MALQKQIAIIGGGPSGLSLARLLQVSDTKHQYVVKVYERDVDANVRIEGGSLDLQADSGQIFIDKAGLRAEYDKVARVEGGFYTMYTHEHTKVWEKAVPQNPEMDRNDLRTLLVNSLAPDTMVWNKHLLKIEAQGDGYWLHFKDNERAYCDIVIGADGAHSKVRRAIAPDLPLTYTGVTVIQGELLHPRDQCPELLDELHHGNLFVLGIDGRCLTFQQKTDGSIIFFLSFRVPEDWAATHGLNHASDKTAFREAAVSICAGYADFYLEILKKADKLVLRHSYGLMYGPAVDARWNHFDAPRPTISLVGDAAHLVPFFGGAGVNNALLDVVELVEELARHKDPRTALDAYEKRMLDRCMSTAKFVLDMENYFHGKDNLRALTKVFDSFVTLQLDDQWKYLLD